MDDIIRIIIADDQALMRDGLKTILDLEEDMEVVYTASDGQETYEMTKQLIPHLVLLDVQMPILDGVKCVKLLKQELPQVKVIMLTTFNKEEYIVHALANGADGFLLKEMLGDELVAAVRNGLKGGLILPAKVAGKLASRLSAITAIEESICKMASNSRNYSLSNREKELAALMIEGMNNAQMAKYLCLTEGTVRNYISIIYDKLGTNDRNLAVSYLKKKLSIRE